MEFRKERCIWNQIIMQTTSQGLEGLMQIVTLFTFHSLEETDDAWFVQPLQSLTKWA